MNLRNVTIWTTGVMMVGAFVFSAGFNLALIIYGLGISYFMAAISRALFFGCLIASPFAISYFTAKKLKNTFPFVILLVPTVACVIVYIFQLYLVLFVEVMEFFLLSGVAILSLPVIILARIIALALDQRYTKNQEPQA